jgi:hypothetical protein
MEVRIAKLTMLLNRAVESSAKTNTNSEDNGQQFTQSVSTVAAEEEPKRQESDEIDSRTAMLSLSSKGIKHSRLLAWQEDMEADEEPEGILETSKQDDTNKTYYDQMTDKLHGLSNQVINGELSTTDKLNFDSELKALMALLENADDESKCEVLSERIDDIAVLINDATVYRNNHMAVFKLTNPDYDKDY